MLSHDSISAYQNMIQAQPWTQVQEPILGTHVSP